MVVGLERCVDDQEDLLAEEGVETDQDLGGNLDLEDRSNLAVEVRKEGILDQDRMHLEAVGRSLFHIADVVGSSLGQDQDQTVDSEEGSLEEGKEIDHESDSGSGSEEGREMGQKEEGRGERSSDKRISPVFHRILQVNG